jgi:uncharacterized protein
LTNHLVSIENEVNSYQERLAMAREERNTLQQQSSQKESPACSSDRQQLNLLRKLISATQIERKEVERSLLTTEAAQKRLVMMRKNIHV